MRVLCLHDAGSSATELKNQLERLGQRLYQNHQIDLLYINSPLPGTWWQGLDYRGLDASLLLARQVMASVPIQGVIGVGQGAAIASILCLLPNIQNPPQFAIFVDGQAILPETCPLADASFPCLHIILHNENSILLTRQFEGTVHHRSGQNLSKEEWNLIGKFLVAQKVKSRELVSLQTALHLAQDEAALAVAQHVAQDPPASLMAIIQPQAVGGWSGVKRKQPQGGGAPCPSDFLLNRQQRANANGPNRVHPNEA